MNDVSVVQFNMYTEKNRKVKYRIVPVVKNDFFKDMLIIVYSYWRKFRHGGSMLFPYTRKHIWEVVKDKLGRDYFPHFIRHSAVTNDTRAGINPSILRAKFGWSDLRPHAIYSHLNYNDLLNAQIAIFGASKRSDNPIQDVANKALEIHDAELLDERPNKPKEIKVQSGMMRDISNMTSILSGSKVEAAKISAAVRTGRPLSAILEKKMLVPKTSNSMPFI